jgi:hypothetical protein
VSLSRHQMLPDGVPLVDGGWLSTTRYVFFNEAPEAELLIREESWKITGVL